MILHMRILRNHRKSIRTNLKMLQGGRGQDQYIKSFVDLYTINEKSQNETKKQFHLQ